MPKMKEQESDDDDQETRKGGGDASTGDLASSDFSQLQSLPTLQTYQATPNDAASYGSVNFWDEQYMNSPDQFDWYHPYVVIRELIREYCKLSDNILIVGCGNSRLTEDMYYDGYNRLTSLDFSAVVIDLMMDEYQDISDLTWVRGNVLLMDIPDETFDVVLDKAMLDSLLCGSQPVHDMQRALNEIERVLKPSGTYLCMSVGSPDQRLEYLEDDALESPNFLSWDVTVHAVPKAATGRFGMLDLNQLENYYYIYSCKKRPDQWDLKLHKMGKKKKRNKLKGFDPSSDAAATTGGGEQPSLAISSVDSIVS